MPGIVFDLFPSDWFDPQFLSDLAVYEGEPVKAVRENPGEFVRDGMSLYDHLQKKHARPSAAAAG
jgi:hypothetical protein